MSHGIVMDYDLSTSIPCHCIPSHSITTHKSNRTLIEIVRLATLCRKGKNVSQSGSQAIRKNQMPSHDNFIEFNYNFHTWVWVVQILSWATGFRMADTYVWATQMHLVILADFMDVFDGQNQRKMSGVKCHRVMRIHTARGVQKLIEIFGQLVKF